MTVLITGGTGKTGTELAKRLQAANLTFLVASRNGKAPEPFKGVAFNWLDPTTFENPFNADSTIDKIYLVAPLVASEIINVRKFIDLARSKGVKRFVLLSASQVEAGRLPLGEIHQYLIDIGVEYAVLRPTWFQQNFGIAVLTSIRDYNSTATATGNGRIAFVSTEDIAEAAYQGLIAEPSLNRDLLVFGPELLSHDEVAKLFSTILGREITHKKYTVEEMKNTFITYGLHPELAAVLSAMEGAVGENIEENLFASSADKKYVGKKTLEEYILNNRDLWLVKQ